MKIDTTPDEKNLLPSFSAIYALDHGYNMVMYSITHQIFPLNLIVHEYMEVRLVLKYSMCLLWNSSIVHCGTKSRTNSDWLHLEAIICLFVGTIKLQFTFTRYKRRFCQLHQSKTRIYYNFGRDNTKYHNCGNEECIVNISDSNMD